MYINCHSYYSLRYGTLKPEELLQLADRCEVQDLALTDVNNTSACMDFLRLAPKYKVRPVVGIDFRNGAQQCYVGLAKNQDGFAELAEHLSTHAHTDTPFEERAPRFRNAFVIYPFRTFKGRPEALTSHEFIGVRLKDLDRLRFSPIRHHQKRLVLMQTVTFRTKKDFNAHRLLRAIDNNSLLSKLPKSEEGDPGDCMWTAPATRRLLNEYDFLWKHAQTLLRACDFTMRFGTDQPHRNLHTYSGDTKQDAKLIRKLAHEGLAYRYPEPGPEILERMDKELSIIEEKGFVSYFLINWDITSYARSKGYFYVGRGSGANSIIAYLLRITDVDPIELDLYFERFINLYRQNPPDFDIDFSWTDRDDVTRYIFERFPHVTLLGAYVTFQYKAVVRELGKVFGLPKHEIDKLSDAQLRYDDLDHLGRLVLQYGALIQDFPNYLGIHAAGILISQEAIYRYSATFLPPKGYPTTHFDMVVAEDIGLYKFDILSQRGLSKIKDTLEVVRYNRPLEAPIDIHDIKAFKRDPNVADLLRHAQAIGCFYVESPAMRMLLRKLQVDNYLGLVAASSVIRPGVAQSGMMREYIQRYRFPERRQDAHPVMLDLMPDTYGVMVYQEDVIKVAHYFAGLTLGEADVLRRGMSGKFRSRGEFNKAQQAFFDKAEAKGHAPELVAEIWRQVESFAGYAFAKGHSASYAVESYQSLFLKAYYPREYMVATINNYGGFYRTELYVHEARKHGARVEAPCVNRGQAESVIVERTIFMGMSFVKSLDFKTIERVLEVRAAGGAFTSLEDFIARVPASLEHTTLLVRAGAFRFTGEGKKELLWRVHLLLGKTKKDKHCPQTLFQPPVKNFDLPALFTAAHEDAFDELELLGFPLSDPFLLLAEPLPEHAVARQLPQLVGQEVTVVGYQVTVKPTKSKKGQRMFFGTFLDAEGEWLDTVHFPPVAEKFPFRGRGVYAVRGTVSEEFGCISVEAQWMEKLPVIQDPRYAEASTVTRIRANEPQRSRRSSRWQH